MQADQSNTKPQFVVRFLMGLTLVVALLSWTAAQVVREHRGVAVIQEDRNLEGPAPWAFGGSVDLGDSPGHVTMPTGSGPAYAESEPAPAAGPAEWGARHTEESSARVGDPLPLSRHAS